MEADRSLHGSKSIELIHAEISGAIIGAFYVVYNELGFGFLESVYARAIEIVLRKKGFQVDREHPLVIQFQGEQIGFHRCDMLVNRAVIVEIKASEILPEFSKKQVRNYLACSKLRLGMLLHFGPKAHYYRILGPATDSAQCMDESA